jgi:transcription antitermination factor NusG
MTFSREGLEPPMRSYASYAESSFPDLAAMTGPWVILRCTGSSTLRLAESLSEEGYDAWAPIEPVRRVVRGKPEWVDTPLIPSFVFASAVRLGDLFELAHSPSLNYQVWDAELEKMVTKGHPFFRVFRHLGEVALISDAALVPLRNIERRRKPRGIIKPIEPGTSVRLTEGGFAGMTGVVESVKGKRAIVSFARYPFPVEFPMWLLREELDAAEQVNVNGSASERAARAA